MSVRLRGAPVREASPEGAEGRGDAAAAWLNAMCAVLRFPPGEARAVREELESHLRDRIDDLMLGGLGEDEATRRAIAELGEAAAVAARFREVRGLAKRRLFMNVSLLVLAGGAALMSVVAIARTGEPQVSTAVYAPAAPAEVAAAEVEANFNNAPLPGVLEALGAAAGMPVRVDWAALEASQIGRTSQVTLELGRAPFERAFALVAEQLAVDPSARPDFRVRDGAIWVSTRGKFDRAETVLMSYDLAATVRGVREREAGGLGGGEQPGMEEITGALMELVEPEGWRDAGGDIAMMHVVGQTLFVKAPPRYHEQIRWVLAQLPRADEGGAEVHVVPRVESSGPDGAIVRLGLLFASSGSGR